MRHLKSKIINRKFNLLLCKTIIRPVLTYGAELGDEETRRGTLKMCFKGRFYARPLDQCIRVVTGTVGPARNSMSFSRKKKWLNL
jgi:hypothetical protein